MEKNTALDCWLVANPCPEYPVIVPWWVFKACLVASHHGLPNQSDTLRTIAEKCRLEISELELLCLLYVAVAVRYEPEYFGEYLRPSKGEGLN